MGVEQLAAQTPARPSAIAMQLLARFFRFALWAHAYLVGISSYSPLVFAAGCVVERNRLTLHTNDSAAFLEFFRATCGFGPSKPNYPHVFIFWRANPQSSRRRRARMAEPLR